jgi:hypothetical protein
LLPGAVVRAAPGRAVRQRRDPVDAAECTVDLDALVDSVWVGRGEGDERSLVGVPPQVLLAERDLESADLHAERAVASGVEQVGELQVQLAHVQPGAELVSREPQLAPQVDARPDLRVDEEARLLDDERSVLRGADSAGIEIRDRRVAAEAHVLVPGASQDVVLVLRVERDCVVVAEIDRRRRSRLCSRLGVLQRFEPRPQSQQLLPHGRRRRRVVGEFLCHRGSGDPATHQEETEHAHRDGARCGRWRRARDLRSRSSFRRSAVDRSASAECERSLAPPRDSPPSGS